MTIEIDMQDLNKLENKKVWVKDSSKKGGGYWSTRKVGQKEKPTTEKGSKRKEPTLETNVPGWGDMPAITSDKAKVGDKKFHYGAIFTIIGIEEKPRTVIFTLESPQGDSGKAKYKKTAPLVLQEHYESALKSRGKVPNLVNGYYKSALEINIDKLQKSKRGTHEGPVQVKRAGKVHTEIRRLGKKPAPNTGKGKMDALPQEIKAEILQLRSANTSGTEIKHIIENLIAPTDNDNEFIFIVENKDVRRNLQSKLDASKAAGSKALHEGKHEEATKHDKEYKRLLSLVNTEIPISTSKVIGEDRKLKVTGQGITEWAKNQGVTARKKRQSVAEIREEIESKWKDDWHKVNVDKASLETQVKELENDVRAQRSQKEGIQDQLSHCRSQLLQSKTK